MRDLRSLVSRASTMVAIGAALLVAAPAFATPLKIATTSPLPVAAAGVDYSFQFQAIPDNNKYPLRWSDKSCFLDAGLTLTGTGLLRGTPGPPGTYTCAVLLAQYWGDGYYYARGVFTLVVNPSLVPPQITSSCPDTAIFGRAYSKPVTVTGSEPVAVAVAGLPPGLKFDPLTRLITGTPGQSGDFPLSITAANGAPPDASQSCTLKVAKTPAVFTFTVKPDPAVEGQPVVTTGTLAGGNPAPTGAVQFWIASSVERCPAPFEQGPLPVTPTTLTAPLSAGGEAKATFNALIAGVYHACAEYKGDAVYDPARAGPVDLFIIKGALLSTPKLTLSAPTSVAPGGVLSPQITVAGDGANVPAGRVTLRADGREIGSALLRNGAAFVSMTAPVAGQVALTAVYFGDGNYAPGVSEAAVVAVAKAGVVEAIPALSDLLLVLLALLLAVFAAARIARRPAR